MAWRKEAPPKTTPSTIRQLVPLVIAAVVLAAAAYIGYQLYLTYCEIRQSTKDRMGKKNVVFTRDGVKVGVKQIKNERYVDKTQSWVVKAWNLGKGGEPEEELKKKK